MWGWVMTFVAHEEVKDIRCWWHQHLRCHEVLSLLNYAMGHACAIHSEGCPSSWMTSFYLEEIASQAFKEICPSHRVARIKLGAKFLRFYCSVFDIHSALLKPNSAHQPTDIFVKWRFWLRKSGWGLRPNLSQAPRKCWCYRVTL
jgi:hypothetical protein